MLNNISLFWRNMYQDSVVLEMGIEAYGNCFDFQIRMARQYEVMKNVNRMIWLAADVD